MCDAIHLQGLVVSLRRSCIGDLDCSWLLEYPVVNSDRKFKSFRSAVSDILVRNHFTNDLSATLHKKVLTTLSPVIDSIPPFSLQWFNDGFKGVFALSFHSMLECPS